ncbi:carboxyl-terminal protease [Conexibacter woesei DSM 14684]|uniref:Carboxyl-terminal protease n=1 Tax=Conexibacter woesei (strain DSM 14684 / CCUG 47730 / CIP 108061 / JCM 11494 / NBRC 100937 / ID131577) TaxID=469383 RepID=D3F902_CONWI|nr:carboxyl-terminal protease [Conexibacter woesei DSM 14684]
MVPRRASRIPLVLAGALIAVVMLGVGIYLGGHASNLPDPIRSALVDDDESQLMQQAIDTISDAYYRPVSRDELVNKSVEGAVNSLDDQFSHYFDPRTYERFQHATNPRFSGIGVTVQGTPRGLRVAHVIDDTPAAKAGLRDGDMIVAVGRSTLAGHPASYGISLVKGEPGTTVELTIERDGRRRVQTIERAEIVEPVVEGRMVQTRAGRFGVVVFTSFTSNSSAQVRAAVDRLLARGARGIVLDLRGNGGGLLNEAVDTASIFIPDGTIVSTDGRARERHVYTATGGAIRSSVPVVVLVDRNTASSSEIVTGALQDRRRAEVVGTRTYGKGVFQEIRELPNGGALDITVGQYFLPSGKNIGGRGVREGDGIQPDVQARDDPDTRRDEGLDAALRALATESR